MSSTYSPDLRIELIGTGDQAGVWGATTNNNMAYVLEQAIAGYVSVAVASANQALTYLNGATSVAADNQSVHASLALTTSTGANFAVYAPPASKQYTIYNASSYTATIYNSTVIGNTTAAGTGVAIPAGKVMTVWSDGTNFAQQNTHLISPTVAGGTLTSPTLVTPALGTPASGTLTNATGLPISTGVSGLGTGVATALAVNVGSAGAPVVNGGALGTPSSGTLTNATGLPLSSGVTGTLPVANGGTGATALTANNVLLGNGTSAVQVVAPSTSGNVLTSNGTTWTSTALPTRVSSVTAGDGLTGGTITSTGTIAVDTSYAAIGCTLQVIYSASSGVLPGATVSGSYLFYQTAGAVLSTGNGIGVTFDAVNRTTAFNDSAGRTWTPLSGTWRSVTAGINIPPYWDSGAGVGGLYFAFFVRVS